jgi:hypothetical protein
MDVGTRFEHSVSSILPSLRLDVRARGDGLRKSLSWGAHVGLAEGSKGGLKQVRGDSGNGYLLGIFRRTF